MKTCTICKEIKYELEFCKNIKAKDGLQTQCKCCRKINAKIYSLANKEKKAIYGRAYREVNKDQKSISRKIWRELNKDREHNKDKLYYLNNKEYILARNKNWKQNNPELRLATGHKRRALKRNAEGTYTYTDITNLIQIQNSKCVYCQVELITKGKGIYHVDHRMPLFLGGTNFPENLQLLCPTCNLSKSYKHPDIYEKQINHNQNKEL